MPLEYLESVTPGEILILRDDVLRHIKTREYIYERKELDNTIFILHKSGNFGLHVKKEDIDWEAYLSRQPKSEKRTSS